MFYAGNNTRSGNNAKSGTIKDGSNKGKTYKFRQKVGLCLLLAGFIWIIGLLSYPCIVAGPCEGRASEERGATDNGVAAETGTGTKPCRYQRNIPIFPRDSERGGDGGGCYILSFGRTLGARAELAKGKDISSTFSFSRRPLPVKGGGRHPPVRKQKPGYNQTGSGNVIDTYKLCLAIAKHETGNCAKGNPGTAINNCNGIMYWDKAGKRHLAPYKSVHENTLACVKLWNDHYKGLPTLSKARKWSGWDRSEAWLANTLHFYYE